MVREKRNKRIIKIFFGFCILLFFGISSLDFDFYSLFASEVSEKVTESKLSVDEEKESDYKSNVEEEKEKKESRKKKKVFKKKVKSRKKRKVHRKKVYLTFDDGPSENTVEILKILDKYEVKATFFVIGREDKASLKIYKDIVNKGHTIALHSYTHNYKQIYASLEAFQKDYKRISDLVFKATGVRSNYYRFPGGTSNTVSPISMQIFVDYFNKKGIRYFDWNIQCGDAVRYPPAPQKLFENVVHPISNRKDDSFIVLIHDSKPMKNSVKALPSIIKWLKKNRYDILPIDDDTIPVHHGVAKKK